MSEQESATRDRAPSPLAEALARVGDRWTLLIVQALLPGPRRFNELLEEIPGIAASILSERLKRLERDALLVSRPYTERPARAAYQLTSEGMELVGALRLLAQWGARHAVAAEGPTGVWHPLEADGIVTCDRLVEDEPEMETHFL
jgi:DNA-binding HxlR family transcriptional regulator